MKNIRVITITVILGTHNCINARITRGADVSHRYYDISYKAYLRLARFFNYTYPDVTISKYGDITIETEYY